MLIHMPGKDVYAFREGDRVMSVNHSSGFAEYSVRKTFTTAIIPSTVSFEGEILNRSCN